MEAFGFKIEKMGKQENPIVDSQKEMKTLLINKIPTKQSDIDKIFDEIKYKEEVVASIKDKEKRDSQTYWRLFSGRGYKKLHIPKTYTHVTTLLAKFINSFLQPGTLYRVIPRTGKAEPEGRIKTMLLELERSKIPMYRSVFIKQVLQTLIEGWCIIKVGWDFNTQTLQYPFILNEDISFDPTANTQDDIGWVQYKVLRSKKYLERMEKDEVYENISSFISKADEYRGKEDTKITGITENSNPYKEMYAIRECWDLEKVYTVGMNGDDPVAILRAVDNPHIKYCGRGRLPFIVALTDPEIEGLKGFGVPELMADLNDEVDTTRRLRIMALRYAILGFYSYTGAIGEDVREVFRNPSPGGLFHLENDTMLTNWAKGNVPGEAFAEERVIDADIDNIHGTNKQIQGQQAGRQETLGEHLSLKASGNERIAGKLLVYSLALQEAGKYMLYEVLTNREVEDIKPFFTDQEQGELEDIFEHKDVWKDDDVIVDTNLNPYHFLEQEKLTKIRDIVSNTPMADQVNWGALWREIAGSVKPGWQDKLSIQESELLVALDKMPPEVKEKVVSLGMQAYLAMQKIQAGQQQGVSFGGVGGGIGGQI